MVVAGAIGGLLYSLRSARVSTWPRLPYGTSPPRMLEMNLRGRGAPLGPPFVGCDCDGGGVRVGLVVCSNSECAAPSQSLLSRSIDGTKMQSFVISFYSEQIFLFFAKNIDLLIRLY